LKKGGGKIAIVAKKTPVASLSDDERTELRKKRGEGKIFLSRERERGKTVPRPRKFLFLVGSGEKWGKGFCASWPGKAFRGHHQGWLEG